MMLEAYQESLANVTENLNQKTCHEYEKVIRFLGITVVLILAGFAITGNVFIIILALKYTIWKNLHHLIINMASLDIVLVFGHLLLYSPHLFGFLAAIDKQYKQVHPGEKNVVCKAMTFALPFLLSASLVTLTIISIERFKATRLTAQRLLPYTLKRRLLEITCTYAVSAVIPFFGAFGVDYQDNFSCIVIPNIFSYIYLSSYITFAGVQFVVILVLSCIGMKRLSRPPTIEAQINEVQRQARAKRITKAVKMVFWSLFLYFICNMTPLLTGMVVSFISMGNGLPEVCSAWQLLSIVGLASLPTLNAFISPFIYIVFLKVFKEAAKRIICRRPDPARRQNRGQLELQ